MLISLPMLFVNSSNVRKPEFSPYDVAMAVFFGIGVLTEIVADIQKAVWVKNGRQGNFCEAGVWKYSSKLCMLSLCILMSLALTYTICFDVHTRAS